MVLQRYFHRMKNVLSASFVETLQKATKLDESPFLNKSYIGPSSSLVMFNYGDKAVFLLLHASLVKSL